MIPGNDRVIGTRVVSISKLKLPGDMQKRMDSPHVKARAENIRKLGLIHKPIVQHKTWQLIVGGDRIAACMLLGWEEVEVEVRDYTDEEVAVIRHAENAHRRHDINEQKHELDALLEAVEREKLAEGLKPRGSGRQPVARAEARREVAALTGVKESTLRKRDERKKKREQRQSSVPPPPAKEEPTINTLEVPLTDEFLAQCAAVQGYIKELGGLLSRASSVMTQLEGAQLPLHTARLQALRGTLTELGAGIRAYAPASLCPYCKGCGGVQEHCGLCQASGWIRKDQVGGVPAKFWQTDEPVVMLDGKERPMSDFATEPELSEELKGEASAEDIW